MPELPEVETIARQLRVLGIEPLTPRFTTRWLREFLQLRGRSAIKPLLLDQRGIAGVGNIYDIEALWRARIHPLRTAGSLRPDEVARLREALRFVLRKGIRLGGASRRARSGCGRLRAWYACRVPAPGASRGSDGNGDGARSGRRSASARARARAPRSRDRDHDRGSGDARALCRCSTPLRACRRL